MCSLCIFQEKKEDVVGQEKEEEEEEEEGEGEEEEEEEPLHRFSLAKQNLKYKYRNMRRIEK
jgi:hypothetical protein